MKFFLRLLPLLFICAALFILAVGLSAGARCPLENLIMHDEIMPSGWERMWDVLPPVMPKEGAEDALSVAYDDGNGAGVAQHRLYQYKNKYLASLFFTVNDQICFPTVSWLWSDADEIDSWKLKGDRRKIRCSYSHDPMLGSMCVAALRYEAYISVISFPVEQARLTPGEFKAAVITVDETISSCLGN